MTATVRTDDVHILIEPEIDIDLSWLDDDDDRNRYLHRARAGSPGVHSLARSDWPPHWRH